MLQKIVKEKVENYCWKLQLQSTLFTILSPNCSRSFSNSLFLKKFGKNVKIRLSVNATRLAENLPTPTFFRKNSVAFAEMLPQA